MSFEVTYYGHSAVGLDISGTKILIDPFFTGNPLAPVKAEEFQKVDFILVSHGHGDHVGDAVSIAQRTGATVISNYEIYLWLTKQGVKNAHPHHIGGGWHYPFGYLKFTQAFHGSQLPDGTDGGNPAGLLLKTKEGKTFYHAGDTGLFSDMKLIGEGGLDIAFLPIGDNFTMGPDDALKAVQFLGTKVAVPMHFNTFDLIKQDAAAWAERVNRETGKTAQFLKPGGKLTV